MIPYYKIEANIRFRARDVAKWLRDRASSRFDVPEAGAKAAANPVRRPTGDSPRYQSDPVLRLGHLVQVHTIRGTRQHRATDVISLAVRTFGLDRSTNIFRAQTLWKRGHFET
jgi:hypothetical protein